MANVSKQQIQEFIGSSEFQNRLTDAQRAALAITPFPLIDAEKAQTREQVLGVARAAMEEPSVGANCVHGPGDFMRFRRLLNEVAGRGIATKVSDFRDDLTPFLEIIGAIDSNFSHKND